MIKSHDKSKALIAKLLLYVFDVVAANLAFIAAIYLSKSSGSLSMFELLFSILKGVIAPNMIIRNILVTAAYILVFKLFGLYDSVWKYAGIYELFQCAIAAVMGGILSTGIDKIGNAIGLPMYNYSGTVYINSTLFIIALIGGIRLLYREMARKEKKM